MARRCNIEELFQDSHLVSEIKEKLPKLFQIAEMESSRAGKVGMEVGSIREKIIIALLIHKFGEENVNTDIPITESEIDVILSGRAISIKSISKGLNGIKAVWTVDAAQAQNFIRNFQPRHDILLVQIEWTSNKGGFFLIPISVQREVFQQLGRTEYLKAPIAGTNPRGVEFTKNAMERMISHRSTLKIQINWIKEDIEYNTYKRWIDYWSGEENLS